MLPKWYFKLLSHNKKLSGLYRLTLLTVCFSVLFLDVHNISRYFSCTNATVVEYQTCNAYYTIIRYEGCAIIQNLDNKNVA